MIASIEITVALIALGGTLLTAILSLLGVYVANQRIGTPNGSGPLTTMVEHLIVEVDRIKIHLGIDDNA